MKFALIYDGGLRDNGTPLYLRTAFAKVLGEQPDWYTQAGKIPEGYDFYFHLDDGRDDLPQVPPHPWGYYATDTHLGPGPRLEKARRADIVWCAQKPAAEEYRAQGINAYWMPLACFPEVHPTEVELAERGEGALVRKQYDVGFVGHLQDPKGSTRVEFLDSMFKAFPSFRFEYGVFHEAMATVYHKCRIGLNHAVRDDLNMRFFELASVGVPQLCDSRMVGLAELGFRPYVHFLPYTTTAEAVEVVRERVHDPGLAQMASDARELVRMQHKYTDRVQNMIRQAEAVIG